MKRYFNFGMLFYAGLFALIQAACTKSHIIRQPNAMPIAPGCDTCSSAALIDKELILYLTGINWQDRGNGRFECNMIPMIEGQGIKTDSANLLSVYVGLGSTAIKMDRGVSVDYNGNSLVWFGYKLNLQLGPGRQVPLFLAIRLELQWI